MTELRLALDRASVRRKDEDTGHLHVSLTPISKACVNGYLGREIPNWQKLGLASDKIYRLYRDSGELEKAADTFDGKPLLIIHKAVHANDHPHEEVVGNVGNPVWKPPFLMAGLNIWTKQAIDGIESEEQQQLSCGYAYDPDMTAGTSPDGEKYDGVMRNLRANHVALVKEGRAGPDVLVHDAKPRSLKEVFPMPKSAVLSRTADVARGALMAYAKPRLAQDAKVDLLPILKGVTSKTILAKAPAIAKAFDAAVRPKLASDADMDQADVQGIVEEIAEVMKDESDNIAAAVSDPDPAVKSDPDGTDAPDAAAILSFLDGKISDEDMAKLKDMLGSGEAEDRRKRGKPVVPSATDKEPVVTKAAMDAALAKTRTDAAADAMATARSIREAERFVQPWVGDLPIAMDSAEAVHRAALDVLKINHDGKHPDALATMIEAQPKPGERNKPSRIAQDAAGPGVKYDAVTFPHSNRLK